MENKKTLCAEKPACLSFGEAVRIAAEQIELPCAKGRTGEEIYRSIAYVMAEIYMLSDTKTVIDGELMEVEIVKEVFQELTFEHCENVVQALIKAKIQPTRKRAYLRTALYNSVFELGMKNELIWAERGFGKR